MFNLMNIKRFEKLFYDNVIRQFCVDKILTIILNCIFFII